MADADSSDRLFAAPLNRIVDFDFDERVAAVFADMINRSVPGYATLIRSLGRLAATYAQPHSRCYDLGCSLGAVTLAMATEIQVPGCRILAVDNSPAMVARCREHLQQVRGETDIELLCADLESLSIQNASVVVMNYTLQFIAPARRADLLASLCEGLRPGGVLLLSEKIAAEDPASDQLLQQWHQDFKKANGYSELEVSQKRAALERVLQSDTLGTHRDRLHAAGFTGIEVWFQCFNFVSLVAFK